MAFDYIVVVVKDTGVETARLVMSAATSHPAVGDDVEIDGESYVVQKVRHVPHPHDASSRRAMVAEVQVRRAGEHSIEPVDFPSARVLPFPRRPKPGPSEGPHCKLSRAFFQAVFVPFGESGRAVPAPLQLVWPISPSEPSEE
jgi:hypothetical protein